MRQHNPLAPLIDIARRGIPLADSGIELKFRSSGGGTRIIDLREDPGDSSCQKTPPELSPIFDPPPQPTDQEELTTHD